MNILDIIMYILYGWAGEPEPSPIPVYRSRESHVVRRRRAIRNTTIRR